MDFVGTIQKSRLWEVKAEPAVSSSAHSSDKFPLFTQHDSGRA